MEIHMLSASREQSGEAALLARIAPLCHIIRWAAVAWIGWAVVQTLSVFIDNAALSALYSKLLNVQLGVLPTASHVLSLIVVVVDLLLAMLFVTFVWRLFGLYLHGRIFTSAAITEMAYVGWAGLCAVCVDILARPTIAYILTQHIEDADRAHFWIVPNDLLVIVIALFVLALSRIYKVGVAIADENKQIV